MNKLKPHNVDWAQIERFLASADRKLASAHKILAFDEEACLQQAYEAMLRAALGFMFSHGFRARSQPGHHLARPFARCEWVGISLVVELSKVWGDGLPPPWSRIRPAERRAVGSRGQCLPDRGFFCEIRKLPARSRRSEFGMRV